MYTARLLICAILAVTMASDATAKPKSPKAGECIEEGTARREGKDPKTGEKLDCLWDFCKRCKTVGDKIDCGTLVTSYSNPRDCKPVEARSPMKQFQIQPGQRRMTQ